MAGTKYTRKPKKKVAKKNQSITQRGVKKKSNLKINNLFKKFYDY